MNWHEFNNQFRETFWERQDRQRKARNAARAASCGTRPKGGDAHAAPALPSDAAPEGRTPNLSRPIPDTLNAGGCE